MGSNLARGLTLQIQRAAELGVPVYVTENGIADPDDSVRSQFIPDHVAAIAEALGRGIDVRGYFHWSLLDNFEWSEGYVPRFGLIAVDHASQQRTVRASANAYAALIQQAGQARR